MTGAIAMNSKLSIKSFAAQMHSDVINFSYSRQALLFLAPHFGRKEAEASMLCKLLKIQCGRDQQRQTWHLAN